MNTEFSSLMIDKMSEQGLTADDYNTRTELFVEFYETELEDHYTEDELKNHLPYYEIFKRWYRKSKQEESERNYLERIRRDKESELNQLKRAFGKSTSTKKVAETLDRELTLTDEKRIIGF